MKRFEASPSVEGLEVVGSERCSLANEEASEIKILYFSFLHDVVDRMKHDIVSIPVLTQILGSILQIIFRVYRSICKKNVGRRL